MIPHLFPEMPRANMHVSYADVAKRAWGELATHCNFHQLSRFAQNKNTIYMQKSVLIKQMKLRDPSRDLLPFPISCLPLRLLNIAILWQSLASHNPCVAPDITGEDSRHP